MEEIWKDIPGYEGLYQASTEGRIRSCDRWSRAFNNHGTMCRRKIKGTVLKGSSDPDGYLDVDLYSFEKGRPKTCRVNRLIALTFVPNPNNLPQVDHLNGVKDDNRACNLEWVSCKENIQRAWRDGRCTPPVMTEEKIERFRTVGKRMLEWRGKPCKCTDDGKCFMTVAQAARYYRVNENVLRTDILKERWSLGIHFKFISKDSEEYKEMLKEFRANLGIDE